MLTTWPLGIWLGLATLGTLAAATTWRTGDPRHHAPPGLAFGLMLFYYREPAAAPGGEPRRAALVDDHRARGRAHGRGRPRVGDSERGFHPVPELRAEAPPGARRGPAGANLVVGWASFLSIATVPLGGVLLDRDPATGRGDRGGPGRDRRRPAAPSRSAAPPPSGACSSASCSRPSLAWSPCQARRSRRGAATRGSGSSTRSSIAGMGLAPVVAGYLVDRSGGAAALWLAAILWLSALPALWVFRVLQRRWVAAGPARAERRPAAAQAWRSPRGRWHNGPRMTTLKDSHPPLAATPGLVFHGVSFDPVKHTVRAFDLAGFDAELQDPDVFSWVDIQAPDIAPMNEVLRRMDIDLVLVSHFDRPEVLPRIVERSDCLAFYLYPIYEPESHLDTAHDHRGDRVRPDDPGPRHRLRDHLPPAPARRGGPDQGDLRRQLPAGRQDARLHRVPVPAALPLRLRAPQPRQRQLPRPPRGGAGGRAAPAAFPRA